MAGTAVQKNMMHEIKDIKKTVSIMKKELDFIKDRFEDRILSKEDKKAIDEALKAEKDGKLKSMEEVFE